MQRVKDIFDTFCRKADYNMKKNVFNTKMADISEKDELLWTQHALIHLMGGIHSLGTLEKSTSDIRTEIQRHGEEKI